jgi:hypothetical protein
VLRKVPRPWSLVLSPSSVLSRPWSLALRPSFVLLLRPSLVQIREGPGTKDIQGPRTDQGPSTRDQGLVIDSELGICGARIPAQA